MVMKRITGILAAIIIAASLASCSGYDYSITLQPEPGDVVRAGTMNIVGRALAANGITGERFVLGRNHSLVVQFDRYDTMMKARGVIDRLCDAEPHLLEIKKADGTVVCTSMEFTSAKADTEQGRAILIFLLDEGGTAKFAAATQELAGTGEPLQVYYDGKLVCEPAVKSPITDGSGMVDFPTQEEAKQAAEAIMMRPLPQKYTILMEPESYSCGAN